MQLFTHKSNAIFLKARFYTFSIRNFATAAQTRSCLYELLGIKPTASQADIKKAYYEKVKLYHPDTNSDPAAEETFKTIGKAYETLKDPISRQVYDLGKANPNFSENPNDFNHQSSGEYSKHYSNYAKSNDQSYSEYYDNKWHGYGKEYTTKRSSRDEYSEFRSTAYTERGFDNTITRIFLVVAFLLVLDFYNQYRKAKRREFVDVQKELVKTGFNESPLIFQSNLVFIPPRRVTQEEIQKEMREKQFRIEYDTMPIKLSPEAEQMREKYHSKPKTIGLEEYIKKRQIKVRKSEDREHHIY